MCSDAALDGGGVGEWAGGKFAEEGAVEGAEVGGGGCA